MKLITLIYLRREISKRCKFIRCEETFLCDQVGIEAGEGIHPGFSSIDMRSSQINVSSTLKTKSS